MDGGAPDLQLASDFGFADTGTLDLWHLVDVEGCCEWPAQALAILTWCAKPALTRSRRISLSNSAKPASKAPMARPAGVVRSGASVSDTEPTPRCCSSVCFRQDCVIKLLACGATDYRPGLSSSV